MSEIFRVSFGQKYSSEPHPRFSLVHPYRVIEIVAVDFDEARLFAIAVFGHYFSDIYSPDRWPKSSRFYDTNPTCVFVTPAAEREGAIPPIRPHDEGTSYCTGIPGGCPVHPDVRKVG